MRMPFERLMEEVERIGSEDKDITLGQLAQRLSQSTDRIMDAIDANRVVRGERTYIGLED